MISCESVRCSAAARRRSDSFNSFGTYAPIKTPLRFAIMWRTLLKIVKRHVIAEVMKRACKPNSCSRLEADGNHSSRPAVTGRLERPTRKRRRNHSAAHERAAHITFPYLVLHHEEFTWPQLLPDAPVSSYLTVSPITPISRGWFVLCCTCRHSARTRRPDVIRLAALWCSDFPLARGKRLPGLLRL